MSYNVNKICKVDNKYEVFQHTVGINEIKESVIDLVDRDLRIFEPSYKISNLIIRDKAFLFKLYHFRVIVLKDFCLFFHPISKERIDVVLNKMNVMEIEVKRRGEVFRRTLSFENRLLDIILAVIHSDFEYECNNLLFRMDCVFRGMESIRGTCANVNREFAKIHHDLNHFHLIVKEVITVIYETMRNKDDMRDMCLSNECIDSEQCVEEMELIFENYYRHYQQIEHEVVGTMKELESMQKQIGVELAHERNILALFDTQMNMITCGLSFGTFIASIFGMNLRNGWENSEGMFLGMIGVSLGLVIGMPFVFWKKFVQIRRKK